MAKTATRSVDLEPIDRLEEKVKLLVSLVDRLKADQARAADENQRLSRELDALRGRLSASDGLASELSTLKEERDVIRTRVSDMLEQLEALNLQSLVVGRWPTATIDEQSRTKTKDQGPHARRPRHPCRNRRAAVPDPLHARSGVCRAARAVRRREDARGSRLDANRRYAAPCRPRRAEHRRRAVPLPRREPRLQRRDRAARGRDRASPRSRVDGLVTTREREPPPRPQGKPFFAVTTFNAERAETAERFCSAFCDFCVDRSLRFC